MWSCLPLHLITYFLPHISCLRRPKLLYSILFHKFMSPLVPLPLHTLLPHTDHSCNRPELAILQYPSRRHLYSLPVSPNILPYTLVTLLFEGLPFLPKSSVHMTACPPWARRSKNRKTVSSAFTSSAPGRHTPNHELFPAHNVGSTNIC